MSETKKLISAAVVTGLAVSGAHAATDPATADDIADAPGSEQELFIFGGAASGPSSDNIIVGPDDEAGMIDLMIDLYGEEAVLEADDETDFDLAQTVYGGVGNDGIMSPKRPRIQTTPKLGGQVQVPRADKELRPRKPKLNQQGGRKLKRK